MANGNMTQDIGATGLNETWGQIRDDFLTEWNGRQKVERVEEMLKNSPVIGALHLANEMPARTASWFFSNDNIPVGQSDRGLDILERSLENLTTSWNDHISEALLFPYYGWAMFSNTYERVGGDILLRKLKTLGQDTVFRWLFADDGGLEGLRQSPHLWKEPIPIERMIIYRFRVNRGSPEGESILRPAWIPWYYVKNLQQVEAIGIERNLSGLPMIKAPVGADLTPGATDYETAHKILRNARNDEQAGLLIPDGWEFSLISSGGLSKAIDTNMVIGRYERRMLMAALAQFLILGQDKVGALSLSTDQSDFFRLLVNASLDIIAETYSKFMVPRILTLNGIDPAGYTLEHTAVGDRDIVPIGDLLQKTGSMITWTEEDEIWLRALAEMPEKTADEIKDAQEERRALLPMVPPVPSQNGTAPDEDEMGIIQALNSEYFAADNAPDDTRRRRDERMMADKLQAHLTKQLGRVSRGAQELRREKE